MQQSICHTIQYPFYLLPSHSKGQVGDWLDSHIYTGPGSPLVSNEAATQASALGEYGGLGLIIPAHMLRPDDAFYYELESSAAVLLVRPSVTPGHAHGPCQCAMPTIQALVPAKIGWQG